MPQNEFGPHDRVRLKLNVQQRMFAYRVGQQGTVLGDPTTEKVFVRLDGYWLQKLLGIIRKHHRGEASNFSPWYASFSPAELERIS